MNIDIARQNMLNHQLKVAGIPDGPVLDAFIQIPRELFAPDDYQELAFAEITIPLDDNQVMLSPFLLAKILSAAKPTLNDNALEIGTHEGYLSALLAKTCAKVTSVDLLNSNQKVAQQRLSMLNLSNADFIQHDLKSSIPKLDPFDLIIFNGALPNFPEEYLQALRPQQRIITIVGNQSVMSVQKFTLSAQGQPKITPLFVANAPFFSWATKPSEFKF